jgi:hypothetical protein
MKQHSITLLSPNSWIRLDHGRFDKRAKGRRRKEDARIMPVGSSEV